MKLYEILYKGIQNLFGTELEPKGPVVPKGPPVESLVWNPIGAKVGGSVTLEHVDYSGLKFFIRSIDEITIIDVIVDPNSKEKSTYNGKRHKRTSYNLLARPLSGPDVSVVLSVVPSDDAEVPYRALLLSQYDKLAYDDGLHNLVKTDKAFICHDDKDDANPDNDVHDEYWRVNDVGATYVATVKTLDNNSSVNKSEIELWDYVRDVNIDGLDVQEFLFVEMNKDNGWFTILRGTEVDAFRVDVY